MMNGMGNGIRNGRPSILGSSRVRTRSGQTPPVQGPGGQVIFHTLPTPQIIPGRKRVLFVCIGNSCRSQMAEAFAKALAKDWVEAQSAGLSPAPIIQDQTYEVMLDQHGIRLEGQHPKGIEMLARESFDVVVNLSGQPLPRMRAARMLDWQVRDPIGRGDSVYQAVAEQIGKLVLGLVTELREQISPAVRP